MTLFEQAVAEAKTIRRTAIENAKIALEESLAPKFQSMFSSKIQEMEDAEEKIDESTDEELDEAKDDDSLEEEVDLDEILAETDDELEEAKAKEDAAKKPKSDSKPKTDSKPKAPSKPKADKPDFGGDDEGGDDEGDVKDLSVEDLKNVIRDVIQSELSAQATGGEEGMDDLGGDDSGIPDESGMDDLGGGDMGGDDLSGGADNFSHHPGGGNPGEEDDEVNLDELLAELEAINQAGDNIDEGASLMKPTVKKTAAPSAKPKTVGKLEENYRVAVNTVNVLRKELKEINLLNAKLIYLNKIFSSSRVLNESQKMKIIEKFDQATNVKEAKLIFETLIYSLKPSTKNTKSQIKESLSFASKSAGVATKKPIIVDSQVARFQKLAGITKNK